MISKKVLVVSKIDPILSEFLVEKGYQVEEHLSIDRASLLTNAYQYTGIITSTKIVFDKEMISACSNLKWIGRMGSGMEQIDVTFAQSKGIYCCSSPEGNANAVAEQALGMYLALQHRIVKSFLEIRQNLWFRDENRGFEIEGRTAGIIGLGNNGMKLAQKLSALGMQVLAYDIVPITIDNPNIKQVSSLTEIYEHAELLSYHVPYNTVTHHYFNNEVVDQMKNPFIIINLSRGKIVDQSAVLNGLNNGKILGAALDVWEKEPISKMDVNMKAVADSLMRKNNFIGTSHIGGYTHEAIVKMSQTLLSKLKTYI